jgi:integrase
MSVSSVSRGAASRMPRAARRRAAARRVRHGYATQLLAAGVHPAIASAALGHASPSFTMSTYQHVLDGMTDVAADAISAAFES